jgi:transcriptional regulator with XRE-family HTH domain
MGIAIARTTINQLENGQRSISLPEALAIAEALAVPPGELVFKPSSRHVEVLPDNYEMSGDEAVEWLAGYLPVRKPGESRADWLKNAGENHTDDDAAEWVTLGRYERRLYQIFRELQQGQRLLLNARDRTERAHRANNINYITKRGKGLVSYIQRQLQAVQKLDPDFELYPETQALLTTITELPNLTGP